MTIIHTREGHRARPVRLPAGQVRPRRRRCHRRPTARRAGSSIRGEYGHDIVDELAPAPGELVLDKPGKGSFYATDLDCSCATRHQVSLIVTGVTTEVCVHTTVREANDRGYECLVLEDCFGSYFPEFHEVGIGMIAAQGGIFGWVGASADLLGSALPSTSRLRGA